MSMTSAKQGELLVSRDLGISWKQAGLEGTAITALSKMPGFPKKVFALTIDGAIFGREF